MSFFSRLLQPPTYLKLPIFGLDISDRAFKYMKFKETPRNLHVDDFGIEPLPVGLVDSGLITDTGALAQILRAHFAKKPYRFVALALPEEKGFVRTIRMPRVEPEELHEAISLQLEEYIPLPLEEISFAYQAIPDHSPETMDVLITAFPRMLLSTYIDTIKQADLIPVSLEIESQAIARAIIPPQEQPEIVLVIDIGLTRTSFLFAQYGLTHLTSTMPLGGKSFHEAIMKALQVQEPEAERLKKEHGLSNSKDAKPVFDALIPLMKTLVEEVLRRTEFWQEEHRRDYQGNRNKARVGRVYLCGREANLTGLARHLSVELNVPVSLANVWSNVIEDPSYIPEIEFRDSLGYATSIGLALGARLAY
ncbi:MAG: type IV pilus assembly protein PilM [Parcubacteria group bacterium Gr01-1014_29]|nr:MAG: type IV pilus assembly protein PilM [Parcubacteria group bacterium Gr01-1014_29]